MQLLSIQLPCWNVLLKRLLNALESLGSRRLSSEFAHVVQIEDHDGRISKSITKINEHRRRRAFFLGFSQSPVDFINAVIASQVRVLLPLLTSVASMQSVQGMRILHRVL